jgi:hypothetical protein
MRTFLSSTVAACSAALLISPAVASAEPASRLQISHTTGAIYQSDPSPDGDGILYDTVQVTAQLRHCAAGSYFRSITLVQDGVSYEWATQALGAGEIGCTGAGTARAGMAFFGNGLHPGTAVVTVTVTSETDGSVLAQTSRRVRIPAGPNNPG